jgi:hypothetical protein
MRHTRPGWTTVVEEDVVLILMVVAMVLVVLKVMYMGRMVVVAML